MVDIVGVAVVGVVGIDVVGIVAPFGPSSSVSYFHPSHHVARLSLPIFDSMANRCHRLITRNAQRRPIGIREQDVLRVRDWLDTKLPTRRQQSQMPVASILGVV